MKQREKAKTSKIKVVLLLQILLMVYSLFGICSKLAAQQPFLSFKFIMYYGIVILNLAIYAVCWQQIIKRIPLVTAFANKAVTVIWGLIWGKIFFQEAITAQKLLGAFIIICGIVLVVTEKEASGD
ncbi:MAG: EamA family transporter [Lachnospiraceae bacterium]|nr:EamA family transporter [Lachnospiraceae bacterium]